ncbi:MAG: ribose 5-phosphate isomerase B [Deltaproteobacteria bacterium]|nr:ribose 5-phosphate isomerase B [Deltaproteobacteria bacterium]
MRVYVGSDHAGFGLRKDLAERLRAQGREVVDLGPDSDAACDYPEFASVVANAVRGDPGSLGVLVCATGQGMAIAAGKVRGIRAVVPATVEAARLTRFDNNANVLCIGSRLLSQREAFAIVDTWLATGFAGGRHARRIAKCTAIETASAVAFVTESERLRLEGLGIPGRIFDQDATLFASRPVRHARNKSALGWVVLPAEATSLLPGIAGFAREVRRSPLKDLVLLVEDPNGSSAAAVARACGTSGVRVHIAGGREAGANVAAAMPEKYQVNTTFVLVVATPDGGLAMETAEDALWTKVLERCGGDAERAGQRFAAIAPAGSAIAHVAQGHKYRKVFAGSPAAGDGFGPIGHEQLVPAALLGLDPAKVLGRAATMAEACRRTQLEDNPGASLGVLLGAMAKHGRQKLTLLLSKSFLPLGPWIGRLLAVATGQASTGIVTSWNEPLAPSYPPDRIFVHVQASGEAAAATPEQMEALHGTGQPYIQIAVRDRYEILAEIFRWQIAATVAAVVMGTYPFASERSSPSSTRASGS